jgi:hypothetical protein
MTRTAPLHPVRIRLVVSATVIGVLALSSCGSDSGIADSAPPTDALAAAVPSETAPADSEPGSDATVPVDDDVARADDGGGEVSPTCGDLSASDVSAASGSGDIDSADDVSIDTDVTCLFSNQMTGFGVTVTTQATRDYLGGELDGVTIDEALAALESTAYASLQDGATATRVTAGGSPTVVVTGADSLLADPRAFAATVVNGVIIQVSAGGGDSPDQNADLASVVTAVLELAVATQG